MSLFIQQPSDNHHYIRDVKRKKYKSIFKKPYAFQNQLYSRTNCNENNYVHSRSYKSHGRIMK